MLNHGVFIIAFVSQKVVFLNKKESGAIDE